MTGRAILRAKSNLFEQRGFALADVYFLKFDSPCGVSPILLIVSLETGVSNPYPFWLSKMVRSGKCRVDCA